VLFVIRIDIFPQEKGKKWEKELTWKNKAREWCFLIRQILFFS